jgi:hypothetical protein
MLARATSALGQLARPQQAKIGRFEGAALLRACGGRDIGRHGGVAFAMIRDLRSEADSVHSNCGSCDDPVI